MPFISITTPTHNRPQLLKLMIQSVLKQTFTDWELIIVDDSTDNETQKLITGYNHPKITYLKNEKNEGLPFTRNRGMDAAQGKWITYLDDDDKYLERGVLEKVADILRNTSHPWHVFDRVDSKGNTFAKISRPSQNSHYNWTKDFLYGKKFRGDVVHFIQKDLIGNVRFYGNDRSQWQFWFELAKQNDFIYSPIKVIEAEYLPDGLSSSRKITQERFYMRQQFFIMMSKPNTWKYLPFITVRYILSFSALKKVRSYLITITKKHT